MTNNRNKGLVVVLWIALIIFCIPYIVSARYTVFWTDDFSDARRAATYGGSIVYNSMMYTRYMYQSFQGSFASIFIQSFFSPLTRGSLPLLRLISVLNIVLLIVALLFITNFVISFFGIPRKYLIVFLSIVIFPLLLYKSYAEIFYWYTGQTTYTYPLSCGLIAISIMLNYSELKEIKLKKILRYTVSIILLIYGCGGSLQISGIICYLILVMLCIKGTWFFRENNIGIEKIGKFCKSYIEYFVLFIVAFLVSIVNLLGPGNFGRHNVVKGRGEGVIKALFYSFQFIYKLFEFYFTETTFIIFFVIAILVGMKVSKKISNSESVIGILISLGLPVLALFPVLLGYNYDYMQNYYPSRTQFISDLAFIVCMIVCGYILGGKIKSVTDDVNKSYIVVFLCTSTLIYSIGLTKPAEEVLPFRIAESIVTGDLRECADRITNAYKSVEDSNDLDVAILYPTEAIDWFSVVTLSDSPNDWFNQTLARYYGKNSVAFYREID